MNGERLISPTLDDSGRIRRESEPCRREVVVGHAQGLHMRPAAAFAKLARQFRSNVTVARDGQAVNGKSQLELLLLAAEYGTPLVLEVDGDDAGTALEALSELLSTELPGSVSSGEIELPG